MWYYKPTRCLDTETEKQFTQEEKHEKRILSFALALCFVLTLLPAAFADSEPISGTDGDNIAWAFDNGTLTVSGSGEMSDCTWYAAWDDLKTR